MTWQNTEIVVTGALQMAFSHFLHARFRLLCAIVYILWGVLVLPFLSSGIFSNGRADMSLGLNWSDFGEINP